MERKNELQRSRDGIGSNHQDGPDKGRGRRTDDVIYNSRVSHGAHGALVAGKLGILSVNVGCLNPSDQHDQKDTQHRENLHVRLKA